MDCTASGAEKSSAMLQSNSGRFAWAIVGSTCVPCLFRQDNAKYVPIRIVYAEIHSQFFNKLTLEALHTNWSCVETFCLTKAESDLLNYINKHCELIFGKDSFTESDVIVKLDDLIEYYDFLDASYNMLLSERSNGTRSYKCGFLRINNDNNSIVPYVTKNNRKYLPTFYFDDETKSLDAEAIALEDLDLAYLKFCCKAQGIKDDLIASDKCYVVSLEQIKLHFTEDTVFNDFWPADALKTLQTMSRVEPNSSRLQGPTVPAGSARMQKSEGPTVPAGSAKMQMSEGPTVPAGSARMQKSEGPTVPAVSAKMQKSASRINVPGNNLQGSAPPMNTAGVQQATSRVEANNNSLQGPTVPAGSARMQKSEGPTVPAGSAKIQKSTSRVEVPSNSLRGQALPANRAGMQQTAPRVDANSNRLQGLTAPAGNAKMQPSELRNHLLGQVPPANTAGMQPPASRVIANKGLIPSAVAAKMPQSTSRVEVNGKHLRGPAPAGITKTAPPPSYEFAISNRQTSRWDSSPPRSSSQRIDMFAPSTSPSSNVPRAHQNAVMTNPTARPVSQPYQPMQSMRQPYTAQRKNCDPRYQVK